MAFDREDWLYLSGAVAVSAGCALIVPAWGLLSIGAFAMLPCLMSMVRGRGPQK